MDNFSSKVADYTSEAKKVYPNLNLRQASGRQDSFSYEFANSKSVIDTTNYAAIDHSMFIHYTSVQSLFNIVNDKQLRLYNLHNLNDPKELIFALDKIGVNKSEINIAKYQNCLFVMSLCGYDEETNKDDFNLWRLYGQDGSGAAIVFEITNINHDWRNAFFGKVLYGENDELNKLREFINFHHKFNNPHKYINNYPSIIPAFSLFHKNSIWKIEHEYRLLVNFSFDGDTLNAINTVENHFGISEVNHAVNQNGRQTAYINLPLNFQEFEQKMQQKHASTPLGRLAIDETPLLKIKKILLGYNISEMAYKQIKKTLSEIMYHKLGYKVDIDCSYLRNEL